MTIYTQTSEHEYSCLNDLHIVSVADRNRGADWMKSFQRNVFRCLCKNAYQATSLPRFSYLV